MALLAIPEFIISFEKTILIAARPTDLAVTARMRLPKVRNFLFFHGANLLFPICFSAAQPSPRLGAQPEMF